MKCAIEPWFELTQAINMVGVWDTRARPSLAQAHPGWATAIVLVLIVAVWF